MHHVTVAAMADEHPAPAQELDSDGDLHLEVGGNDVTGEPAMDGARLRDALQALAARDEWSGIEQWEAIGRELLTLAERDSRAWRENAEEYQSAYLLGAIELLRLHLESVLAADQPLGMLVRAGQFSGQNAVLAERSCGLTDRDPVTHRTRLSLVPPVSSLNNMLEHNEPAVR